MLLNKKKIWVEISKTGWDFVIWKFEEIDILPWYFSPKYPTFNFWDTWLIFWIFSYLYVCNISYLATKAVRLILQKIVTTIRKGGELKKLISIFSQIFFFGI